jgi:hypothetical protein
MSTFFYRCPNTGFKVKGWVADDPTKDEAFEPVTCTACARVHLVNPKTGKVEAGHFRADHQLDAACPCR